MTEFASGRLLFAFGTADDEACCSRSRCLAFAVHTLGSTVW
jgi:hypothetical protein